MIDPHGSQQVTRQGAPLGSAPVLVMLHGRGAGPKNILDLVPRLGAGNLTFLAPAAAANSWYPLSFLADVEKNQPFLDSALRLVASVVDEARSAGVPSERIAILGFSQGACLACEFAFRNPRRYGAIIAFTGGLIGPPGTSWSPDGSLAGTPVFLGNSDADAHVPKSRSDETAAVFTAMNAAVDLRIYPAMGHIVNDDEINAARGLLTLLTPNS